MSDAARWARVTEVFEAALAHDAAARASYLDEACGADAALRSEVESLLAAHHAAGGFVTGSPLAALSPAALAALETRVAPLAAGMRLGPYEIVEPLSSGGMGELFRGRDTRLGRDVAIKVPLAAASDPATRQRFHREARAIAMLNHPHICTVHDVGSDSGIDYLVLELLQGETLASRLQRGPLSVDEAITRAIEIADALARAHQDGIVHRDLKPGNVMLTPSGVKVLDFGLARITRGETDAPISATDPAAKPLTDQGAVLGTLQYMSPEQLEGRVADARSDIYAFGATLFEMLTGKRAYESASAPGVMLPPALDHVVRTCLERDPEARFASLHDVTIALQWARKDLTLPVAVPKSSRRRIVIGAVVAVGVFVAGVAAWPMLRPPAADLRPVRFSIEHPPMLNAMAVSVSPDGQTIAFSAVGAANTSMLYLRPVGALQARVVAGTEGAFGLFWSPDSQHVAFGSPVDKRLKTVAVSGGEPRVVCDIVGPSDALTYGGGSWGSDGIILFATAGTLYRSAANGGSGPLLHRVPADGGKPPVALGILDSATGETGHFAPHFLPDGRHFLYISFNPDATKLAIFVGSLDSSERKWLRSAESVAYVPGYLLFTTKQRLFAQRFDPSTFELTGDPISVAERLISSGGRSAFAASDKTLAYRAGPAGDGDSGVYALAWFDRKGTVTATFRGTFQLANIKLSPDGKRVAVVDRGRETGEDIWIYDLERNEKTLLANDRFADHYPVWSPEGSRIAFDRGPGGNPPPAPHLMYEQRVDGAEPAKFLMPPEPGVSYGPLDWTSGYFVFQRSFLRSRPRKDGDPLANFELWVQQMSGDRKPVRYVTGLADNTSATFSPNGRWLAYVERQGGGKQELIVRSFPNPALHRYPIATSGACPRWSQDGRELYFLAPDNGLYTVPVVTEGTFKTAQPERLFTVPLGRVVESQFTAGPACPYDARADGQRFLVALPGGANRDVPIQVVLNWMADLKR